MEIDNGGVSTASCSFIPDTLEHTDQGFVKSWLMLGPFEQPNAGGPDCATAALDYLTDGDITQEDIRPEAGDEVNTDFGGAAFSTGLAPTPGNPNLNPGGIPTWDAHMNFDDTIDYSNEWYLGGPDATDNTVVYSAFYIEVPEDITVDIGIGSDDTMQVLVDGEEAGCITAVRGWGVANEVQNVFRDVELSAGQHLVMTKVFDGCCHHGHRLRFQRNGSPLVPGEITLEPDDVVPLGSPLRPGDVNGDGSTNIADMIGKLSFLFGGGNLPECYLIPGAVPQALNAVGMAILDYNGDGAVNITDAVAGLDGLFGGGSAHALGESCVEFEGSCPPLCVD